MHGTFHYTFSLVFNFFLRILLNSKLKDNLGGYFCIRKSALTGLNFNKIFYGYGEYYFRLLFFLRRNNKSMIEIAAYYNKRNAGESKSNFFILLFKYSLQAIILKITNI